MLGRRSARPPRRDFAGLEYLLVAMYLRFLGGN